jgi:diphthamide synthase (EF-2-diphthine--ammonia ligase)
MRGVFPLWKRETATLGRELIAAGFKSVLTCVEGHVGRGFAGRPYDLALLASLPAHVDPCGERGEFHTFAYDGPVFRRPVRLRVGDIVIRDGREYADLLLEDDSADARPEMPPV